MSDNILGWMTKAGVAMDDVRLTSLKKAAVNTKALSPENTLKFVSNFFAPIQADKFAEVLSHLRKSDSLLGSSGEGAAKDVQYLVGGAIEQALEKGEYEHAAMLSLAVVVGSLVGLRSGEFPPEITIYANDALPKIRAGYLAAKAGPDATKGTDTALSAVKDFNGDVPTAAKTVYAAMSKMRGEYNDRISDMMRKLRAAEEEREYLWRYVTRFSDAASCTYDEVKIEAEPCLVGIDYAVASGFPVPPSLVRTLMKISLDARQGASDHPRVALKSAIAAIPADTLKSISGTFDVHGFEPSFPVLTAVSLACNSEGDAWAGAYRSNTGIDAGVEFARADLAYQTLLEVQLHRLTLPKQA